MVMMVPPASHSVEALSKPHHPPPLSDLLLNPSVCIGKWSFCDSKDDDDDDKLPVKLACIALESPPLTSQPHSEVLPGGELLTKYEPSKNPWPKRTKYEPLTKKTKEEPLTTKNQVRLHPWPKKNQVWTSDQKRTKYEPLTKKEPSKNPWPKKNQVWTSDQVWAKYEPLTKP